MYRLYISYNHKAYRLIGKPFNSLSEATNMLERYTEHHAIKGDKLKLVVRK